MKWLLMAFCFLPILTISFCGTIVWNLSHDPWDKTTVQECFHGIWGIFERL